MGFSAQEIISALFNPDEVVCLRVFDDRKGGVFAGAKLQVRTGKFATIEPTLQNHNAQNRGIFFVVNYGGQEDAVISRINAQFVEMDKLSFEEQQKRIDAFPLPPSMIIKTKKSLHTYWFMKNADVKEYRRIQKQLVKHFDGDPMCVNESRCMRLPGFNHCKGDPVMVECILFRPERKYSQSQLSDALPQVESETAVAKQGAQKGLNIVVKSCDFIKHCKTDALTLSEHDWYAMITNLAPFEGGNDVIHAMSKPYPGYSHENTQKKINHYLESGTKPITCQTIADKGFVCPKLATCGCGCKSPAALCYLPMSLDGIRAVLAEQMVQNAVVNDLQTARKFIEDYLYNVDSVTAESIINYDLKAHFGFKAADVKPLLSLHKELFKKWSASSDTKRHQPGMDIPDWYEPTDSGLRFMPGVLADHLAKELPAFYAAEQYYRYENGVYCEVSDLCARNTVRSYMLPKQTKLSQITDAAGQWQMQIQKDIRELNANPYIINCRNGLMNVLDGTLSEHTPDYLSTVQLAVNYSPSATCPRFIQYLHECLEDDQIPLVQEMLGYFLVPVTRAQKCFVIVGEGGAGKSQLLLVLNEILLGKENVSNVAWQSLNERFKTAELFGKLANIFADLPTKNIDDNGIFKALVGEDYLTVEKKNKNPFSFQSTARLLFSCNRIPRNYGDRSEGFYRRLIIIRFDHAVPEEMKDPALIEKLRVEADGIFLFALEGLKRLIGNNFVFSETEANCTELQRYREDSNSVLSFVKDCCTLDPDAEVARMTLFNAYNTYCKDSGFTPYNQRSFNTELEANFPKLQRDKDNVSRRCTYRGIKVDDSLD